MLKPSNYIHGIKRCQVATLMDGKVSSNMNHLLLRSPQEEQFKLHSMGCCGLLCVSVERCRSHDDFGKLQSSSNWIYGIK